MPHGQQRNACACLPDQRKPVIDLLKAFFQLAVALLCSLSAVAIASQRILNVGYYEFAPPSIPTPTARREASLRS